MSAAAETIVRKIALDNPDAARLGEPDEWLTAPFADLTGHIVSRHQGYVRTEGPRLLSLLEKVMSKNGAAHT